MPAVFYSRIIDAPPAQVWDVVGDFNGDAPVSDYTATITVFEDVEDNRTFVTWTASFEVTGEQAPVVEWVRDGIFRACLAELARVLDPRE